MGRFSNSHPTNKKDPKIGSAGLSKSVKKGSRPLPEVKEPDHDVIEREPPVQKKPVDAYATGYSMSGNELYIKELCAAKLARLGKSNRLVEGEPSSDVVKVIEESRIGTDGDEIITEIFATEADRELKPTQPIKAQAQKFLKMRKRLLARKTNG